LRFDPVLALLLVVAAVSAINVAGGVASMPAGCDGLDALAGVLLVAVGSAGLGMSLALALAYLHLKRLEGLVGAFEAARARPPEGRSFADEVGECLDRLYLETGDDMVRALHEAAKRVDWGQSKEGRWGALVDFLTLYGFYVARHGGEPWFRDVQGCVAKAVAGEVEEQDGGAGGRG